jgi:hypothetical protein
MGHSTARPTGNSIPLLALLLLSGFLLAALAYWAPWVGHAAAALRLSGQDLGEFVKFVPPIRRGEEWFPRQLFYVPPLAVSVSLVLLSTNQGLPYPRWLRGATLASSVVVLLGLLPPSWGHPRDLFAAEFRLQGIGVLLGAAIATAHGLFRRLPLRLSAALIVALALAALLAPQAAFWIVRPELWAAYATPTIHLGWGLWLHIAAWLVIAACAGALSLSNQQTAEQHVATS